MAKHKNSHSLSYFETLKKDLRKRKLYKEATETVQRKPVLIYHNPDNNQIIELLNKLMASRDKRVKVLQKQGLYINRNAIELRFHIKDKIHTIVFEDWFDVDDMTIREIFESFIENIRHEKRKLGKYFVRDAIESDIRSGEIF